MYHTTNSQRALRHKGQLKALVQAAIVGAAFLSLLQPIAAAPAGQDGIVVTEADTVDWARNFAHMEHPHPLPRRRHGDFRQTRSPEPDSPGIPAAGEERAMDNTDPVLVAVRAAVTSSKVTTSATDSSSTAKTTTSNSHATTSSTSAAATSSSRSSSATSAVSSSSSSSTVTSSTSASTSATSVSSTSATATSTASASEGFTLTDTGNKLFPLWVTLVALAALGGLLTVVAAVRFTLFPARKRQKEEANYLHGASEAGAGGNADAAGGRSHNIVSRAKTLRKALTTRKVGSHPLASEKADDPSIWLEVGDEVVAVPQGVAREYEKLKALHGQDMTGWNSQASLSRAWVRYNADTKSRSEASLASKAYSDQWNQSTATLVTGSTARAPRPKRGLSTRVADRLRALRGTYQNSAEGSGDTEKTAKLDGSQPVVIKGAEGGWGITAQSSEEKPTEQFGEPVSRVQSHHSTSSRGSQGFSLEDKPSEEARARTAARRSQPTAASGMPERSEGGQSAHLSATQTPPRPTTASTTSPPWAASTRPASQGPPQVQQPRAVSRQMGLNAPAVGRDRLREMRGEAAATSHPARAQAQAQAQAQAAMQANSHQPVPGYPIVSRFGHPFPMPDPRSASAMRMMMYHHHQQQQQAQMQQGQRATTNAYYPANAAQMMYLHQMQLQQQQQMSRGARRP